MIKGEIAQQSFYCLLKIRRVILEQLQKANFKGNIDEINDNNDYIVIRIKDNGTGIIDAKAMTFYYKKNRYRFRTSHCYKNNK